MKRKFTELQDKNPNTSSFILFSSLVRTGKIKTKQDVNKWFAELVDKSDYTRGLRDTLLEHCYNFIQTTTKKPL